MLQTIQRAGNQQIPLIGFYGKTPALDKLCHAIAPDTTQYQYRQLENQTGFTAHSIFDSERINELNLKLKKKRAAPIICAWGVSDDLNPLIDRCISQIGNLHLTGLLKDGNKYYHPLPSLQRAKEEWIKRMLLKLNGD